MKLPKIAFLIGAAALLPFLSASAATVQVQVGAGGLKFTPQNVTINVGDTVQWVWAANGHSTTSGTPGSPDGIWDSGLQNNGFTFSQTFTGAGSFNYFCSPHGSCCGMIGSVSVTAVSDTVTITRAQYVTATKQLTVLATDTNDTATLTVKVTSTGEVLGTMMNKGGGSYSAKFRNVVTNPGMVTVTSNFGGSATARVKVR